MMNRESAGIFCRLWIRRIALIPLSFLFVGCANAPSMLEPKGPAAQAIADLWWLLFWLATAVFLAVFGLMVWALFRRRPARQGSLDEPRGGTRLVVWGGFAVAMGLTGWGLLRMEINDTYRAYLGVSWLYLVTSAFTLAKTLRDRHEADLSDARVRGEMAGRQQALHERDAADE